MGKVTPPPEVFNEWSPEAQESYYARLDNMAEERDTHLDKASQFDESAADHERMMNSYQGTIDNDGGKYGADSAKFDGTVVLVYKHEAQADSDREAAAAERAQANALQNDIDNQSIAPMEEAYSADVDAIKKNYMTETQGQIDADHDKLDALKKKEYAIQQELDDTWFFTGDLKEQLAEVQAEIAAVESDIAFNQQNMENTAPPQPEPPEPVLPSLQFYVTSGARLTCPFAAGTGSLTVTRMSPLHDNKPLANITDCQPFANISSFGMCTTLANPQVASATSAALGVLTPQPCIPAITGFWKPGKPDTLIAEQPALLNTDTLQCAWGGIITIQPE